MFPCVCEGQYRYLLALVWFVFSVSLTLFVFGFWGRVIPVLVCREVFAALSESRNIFSKVCFLVCGQLSVGVAASAVTCAMPPDVPVVTHKLSIDAH